jgi:hypothetical protein
MPPPNASRRVLLLVRQLHLHHRPANARHVHDLHAAGEHLKQGDEAAARLG